MTCLFAESVGFVKRRRSYAFPSWSTLLFERGLGEEGRFDVAARSETPKTSCQNHKQQLLRPRSGPSKAEHVKQNIPEQPGWKNSKWSTEQISKKGIKLILKTIGNRKGDSAWSCSRWQTQPEKISKLQSTNLYNVRSEWHWFVRCNLQIFSGCVCHLEQLHAQSPFLFPIVFSIIGFHTKPSPTLGSLPAGLKVGQHGGWKIHHKWQVIRTAGWLSFDSLKRSCGLCCKKNFKNDRPLMREEQRQGEPRTCHE